jgi:hypothetical protein
VALEPVALVLLAPFISAVSAAAAVAVRDAGAFFWHVGIQGPRHYADFFSVIIRLDPLGSLD